MAEPAWEDFLLAAVLRVDDAALVVRLTKRLPEGVLLSAAELAACPYELGLLTRLR